MGNFDEKYIDSGTALPRLGGNEMLYKTLLGKFSASVQIGELDAALADGDYTKAGEIVHAAKGVAGNLALTAFYDTSVVLMDQLRGGEAPQQEAVSEFRKLYGETVEAINNYLK